MKYFFNIFGICIRGRVCITQFKNVLKSSDLSRGGMLSKIDLNEFHDILHALLDASNVAQ